MISRRELSTMMLAGAAAAVLPAAGRAQTAVKARNVVLVHGAWADGSSWGEVIPRLQAAGLNVTAVQNPLTSALAHRAARCERPSGRPCCIATGAGVKLPRTSSLLTAPHCFRNSGHATDETVLAAARTRRCHGRVRRRGATAERESARDHA